MKPMAEHAATQIKPAGRPVNAAAAATAREEWEADPAGGRRGRRPAPAPAPARRHHGHAGAGRSRRHAAGAVRRRRGAHGVGGDEAAVEHRAPHRREHAEHVRHQLHHPDVHRPPRQPAARRRLHRPLRLRHLRARLPPRHGQRARDALRPGLRCRPGRHARRLPPALLDHPPRLLRPHGALLHLRRAAAPAHRTGPRRRARVRPLHALHPPFRLRHGHQLRLRQVPPGAEQGQHPGLDRPRGTAPQRPPQLPLHRRPRLGPPRRRRCLRPRPHGHRAGADGLHHRVVPGRVEGVVHRRLPRHLGLRQALARVRHHALPRDMVHRPHHRPHRRPRRRADRRRLPRHMHEHQRVGGHGLHRPQRSHQRPGLQRARLRPAPGRLVRGRDRRRPGAAHRPRLHGPRAHLQGQLLHHLHQRRRPAARRVQDRRPAGTHHGAQQRAAGALRGGRRRRMAGPRRLHKPRLLLHLRAAAGVPSRLQAQLGSRGDLVRHALWYCRPDAHLAHCGVENGLESRGLPSCKPCAKVGRQGH